MDATTVLKRDVDRRALRRQPRHRRDDHGNLLRLLESLAFEATKSLESVRLMHEEQEKKQIEQELGMARQVQVALSPTAFKVAGHISRSPRTTSRRATSEATSTTSFRSRDGRSAFALGDVSGKGVAAALLAAMAQGALQAQFTSNLPLTEVVTSLNKVLVQRSASNRFITLFCATLDPDGHFTYINAGHNPPILARTERRDRDADDEIRPARRVRLRRIQTEADTARPGDVVVMYTDGVTEAVNADNQMFGDERLVSLVAASASLSADEIKGRVLGEVVAFTSGLPQGDDITLIVLKMR